jgi:F-type H+-transporting ATPase subunit c
MEAEAARYIAQGMIIMTMIATAIGEGYLVGKTMEAIGRNPEVGDSLFTKMIIGLALCESTAIYAFVAFFLI